MFHNPADPLNPLNPLHPLNPFNPANPLNPAHPLNPVQDKPMPKSTIQNSKSQEDKFLHHIKNGNPINKDNCESFKLFYHKKIDEICKVPYEYQNNECVNIKNLILQCK